MLAAPDAIYPQFASHNAFTIAAIHTLAGDARLRVPVPARHGREHLRPGGRPGPARARVPDLRAGRLARDAARLPRAPAARERREHVVRQPHRRSCGRASPTLVADPVAQARADRRCAASAHSRCRPRCYRDRANSRGVDLSDERRARARSQRELDRDAGDVRRSAPILGDDAPMHAAREPHRASPIRPIAATSSAASTRRRSPTSRSAVDDRRRRGRGMVAHASGGARRVPRARGRSARSASARRSSRSRCARPARRCRTRSARCARPSTSAATTRRRRGASSPDAAPRGPIVVHLAVEFSAGDLRRRR